MSNIYCTCSTMHPYKCLEHGGASYVLGIEKERDELKAEVERGTRELKDMTDYFSTHATGYWTAYQMKKAQTKGEGGK